MNKQKKARHLKLVLRKNNVLLQNLFDWLGSLINAVQFVLINTYFSIDDEDVTKYLVQNDTVVTQNVGRLLKGLGHTIIGQFRH